MEIRAKIDDNYMKYLLEKTNSKKATEVTQTALTLLRWAIDEVSNGRIVLSSTQDGKDIHRLVMPELTGLTDNTEA